MKPAPWWVAAVPKDETWVVERFGKSRELAPGFHFFIPKIDKVKSVKSLTPLTSGVVTRGTGVNQDLDIYLVAHFEVVNENKSAYYSHCSYRDQFITIPRWISPNVAGGMRKYRNSFEDLY